ncbi:nitroreductase family protein [Aureibacillus halotolerans]|uniref:Nitroreductase n=1 Tax=Aureibacillus halotolerans TaxID=1508390 RepID=A0A4R6UCU7_9BACI|nr:nitroreductase family protein [Aureibacillus halotolerans]TDQ42869.1 nitroreductase [Aureibacillus halotolerans]
MTQNKHSLENHVDVSSFRTSEHGIEDIFLNRWSSRSYSSETISDRELHAVLEAANWAPSSNNIQPWRFFVAKDEEQLTLYRSFLHEFNLSWAGKAPVLLLIASDSQRANGNPNGAHAFDAGAAWAYLALQASALGLAAHAMGGFDRDKAKKELGLPDSYEPHIIVSLGYRSHKEDLPEALREREVPNTRNPLSDVVTFGQYHK